MSIRNGLTTSLPELEKIIEKISKEKMQLIKKLKLSKKEGIELYKSKMELDIYNKTGFSDDWEFKK
jgi:hypothetical protein